MNALGHVWGGPLPNQVLLSRWFLAARGKAMGLAYLGIGSGGALLPLVANRLSVAYGWRGALATTASSSWSRSRRLGRSP